MIFFHKPEQETPSRKTARKMLALIPVMVLAVAAYSVSVFAWFQSSLTNTGNQIQAGEFSAYIQLLDSEGQPLWSSDGLCDYDGALPVNNISGECSLCITHQGSLPFQYQISLLAGTGPLTLESAEGTPSYTPGVKQLLGDKTDVHTYQFTVPDGTTELSLQFKAAFQNNSVPSLPSGTAGRPQPVPQPVAPTTTATTSPTTAGRAATQTEPTQTTSVLSPTSQGETTASAPSAAAADSTAAPQPGEPSSTEATSADSSAGTAPTSTLPSGSTETTASLPAD